MAAIRSACGIWKCVMLKLANFNNPRLAQSFIDYMAYRGIELSMQQDDENRFVLLLVNLEDQLEAEAELTAFLREPFAKKYQSASWDMAETRTAKYRYRSISLWQKIKQEAGGLTLGVMAACMGIYLLLNIGLAENILNLMHFPAHSYQQWQLWRLFSHALLHFSLLHILFNLLWWWLLAGKIERQLGSAKLLKIFLLSALFSGLAQYQFEGPAFGGLSGVVYALLGYSWIMSKFVSPAKLSLDNSYFVLMLVWLAVGFAQPFGLQIANMAHLFGLITGLLLGMIEVRKTVKQ